MKLILHRDQHSGFTGGIKFTLKAQAKLTDEEAANIRKYKVGKQMLYSNLEGGKRGSGLIGMVSRAMIAIEVTVDDLVRGKEIECKDILEMIAIEGQIKEACENFKAVLDTAAHFGGDEIIEF